MFEDFGTNLERVRARIADACARSGRAADEVTLVAVTKGHPFEAMQVAREHGLTDLGENRVQDARPKLERIDADARVHLIGSLQKNKVNKAVGAFASIMSVDRDDLLERIDRRAGAIGVVQPIWFQVNASDEEQKGGCAPEQTHDLWSAALESGRTPPLGLMTMARFGADESELRSTFARLRELAAGLQDSAGRPAGLSMGMTEDFEIAVEEGATHVRLGTVLFGPRP